MFMSYTINTFLPLIKKFDIYDIGCIILFSTFSFIGKLNDFTATYPLHFGFLAFVFLFVGRARKLSLIDVAHNSNFLEKDAPHLKVYHVSELKMESNSQVSLEVLISNYLISNNYFCKNYLLKYLKKFVNFYIVVEYFPDQLKVQSDFKSDSSEENEKVITKIEINNHLIKELIECPLLVIIKNYDENKIILIRLVSEPRSSSKISYIISFLCSNTCFFVKSKELRIKG